MAKTIEIVTARHGENLGWAKGLEEILTEYSSSDTEIYRNKKIPQMMPNLPNITARGGDIQSFLRHFHEVVAQAKSIRQEIEHGFLTLETDEVTAQSSIGAHTIVKIDNDPNLCEAKHYLTHIISRYESLADSTAFMQGDPTDHVKNPVAEILKSLGQDFACLPSAQKRKLGEDGHDRLARIFGKLILEQEVNATCWSAGACFMASRQAIVQNPLSWYEHVLEKAQEFTDAKFALERLWSVVITPKGNWQ